MQRKIREDTFRLPSEDNRAFITGLKEAIKKINFGDGDTGISNFEREKLSEFINSDQFMHEIASKMIQEVVNGMDSIVESKVFARFRKNIFLLFTGLHL